MTVYCPVWAKHIYDFEMNINDNLGSIRFEDMETRDCLISAVVSEWLELDQIDIFPLDQKSYWLIEFFKAERMIKSKGIRFFSDEV